MIRLHLLLLSKIINVLFCSCSVSLHTLCSQSTVQRGPSLYMFCIQTLGQHKVSQVCSVCGAEVLPSPVLKCSRAAVDIENNLQSRLSFVNNPEYSDDCLFSCSLTFSPPIVYTSVAMTHSLLSSAITNTDWYMESLEEHIVDILHSGFSLYILLKGILSSKHFS